MQVALMNQLLQVPDIRIKQIYLVEKVEYDLFHLFFIFDSEYQN